MAGPKSEGAAPWPGTAELQQTSKDTGNTPKLFRLFSTRNLARKRRCYGRPLDLPYWFARWAIRWTSTFTDGMRAKLHQWVPKISFLKRQNVPYHYMFLPEGGTLWKGRYKDLKGGGYGKSEKGPGL